MNYRRQGFVLTNVLVALPLVAAITTVSYQVANRAIRYEFVVRRQLASEAQMESLARQLSTDAASARSARMDSPGSELLVLAGSAEPSQAGAAGPEDRTVTYQLSETQVTRTVKAPGREPVVTSWTELPARMQLQIEEIAGQPRILWTSWASAAPVEQGRGRPRRISVAAVIGGGA